MQLLHYNYRIEQLGKRYTLIRLLGSGGMADIYEAWDERDHYTVVIKVIKPDVLDARMQKRFLQEGKLAAGLDYPHIIHIHGRGVQVETFTDPDSGNASEYQVPYIVMEHITGGDLKERLLPGRPFPLDEIVRIFEQLCLAVQYAHDRGVIHRDIKPSNILFRKHPLKGDQVVLSDFGLALQAEAINRSLPAAGSPLYMAPEQQQGDPQPASDIFSLGVVLYQLCTGQLPSLSQPPKKPTLLNPALPPALDDVILRALSHNPLRRFASASLFWQAIENAVGQTPLSATGVGIVSLRTSDIHATPSSPLFSSSIEWPSSEILKNHYFISYSRKDLDIARHIKEDLQEHGCDVWMDEDDIPGGIKWDDSVEENIKRSIAVLYLVSPTSRTSRYVLHELEYAEIYKKTIIPLWIRGDTEWAKVVVFGLSSTQYIDLRGEMYQTRIDRLLQTLKDLSDSENAL